MLPMIKIRNLFFFFFLVLNLPTGFLFLSPSFLLSEPIHLLDMNIQVNYIQKEIPSFNYRMINYVNLN